MNALNNYSREYAYKIPSEDVAGILRSIDRSDIIGTSIARKTVMWTYTCVWEMVGIIDEEKANAR